MKRVTSILIVTFLVMIVCSLCSAFPATGEYESIERARATDTDEITKSPLWRLNINRSDTYYGDFILNAKGAWIGTWETPLDISPNSEGRYTITVASKYDAGKFIYVDLEEKPDGLTMYVNFDPVSPRFSGQVEMTKAK